MTMNIGDLSRDPADPDVVQVWGGDLGWLDWMRWPHDKEPMVVRMGLPGDELSAAPTPLVAPIRID